MDKNPSNWKRRDFLNLIGLAGIGGASGIGFIPRSTIENSEESIKNKPLTTTFHKEEKFTFHIFSKHLHFLDYGGMSEAAAEAGFDGVDLTVRPEGHVYPERVKEDLSKAVDAIKKAGLQNLMMTTSVRDASDKIQIETLKTARELGFRYYRTDWLWYDNKILLNENLRIFGNQLADLAKLNQELDIIGDYQNHAGAAVLGASLWDVGMLLNNINNPFLGCQYDIRHATVEGGLSWPLDMEHISPHIHSLIVKDFKWEKIKSKWEVVNTPIGEGMVDFRAYFSMLKRFKIVAPISVHYEYEMPEHNAAFSNSQKKKETIKVMRKDLVTLQKYMKEAGLN